MLRESRGNAQRHAGDSAQTAYQKPFGAEHGADEARVGPQGAERGDVVPFFNDQHGQCPHHRERSDDEHQQGDEEDAPLLVGHNAVERSAQFVARADAESVARSLRNGLADRRGIGPGSETHDERRGAARIAEQLLRQPQRGEHVGAFGFEVEGIDAAHGFRAARVVFERQQRGERSPPHGVERDVGIGQRADAQHPRHRLSDDQPFQIAQPHAPLPGGNGIAELKDSPVGVVDAPDRGGGLTPSVFEQGALLQGERQRADPRDACEGRGVEIPLRKGLPLPRGDGKIGVESRIHRLDERFETVED